eukprot:GILK01010227.1.p1 GENE.GILK01010227.1~~GILK01010227.1.p1  ORF type:complete len:645 (+),score=137.78 GILK01010227.1:46-1935(+)
MALFEVEKVTHFPPWQEAFQDVRPPNGFVEEVAFNDSIVSNDSFERMDFDVEQDALQKQSEFGILETPVTKKARQRREMKEEENRDRFFLENAAILASPMTPDKLEWSKISSVQASPSPSAPYSMADLYTQLHHHYQPHHHHQQQQQHHEQQHFDDHSLAECASLSAASDSLCFSPSERSQDVYEASRTFPAADLSSPIHIQTGVGKDHSPFFSPASPLPPLEYPREQQQQEYKRNNYDNNNNIHNGLRHNNQKHIVRGQQTHQHTDTHSHHHANNGNVNSSNGYGNGHGNGYQKTEGDREEGVPISDMSFSSPLPKSFSFHASPSDINSPVDSPGFKLSPVRKVNIPESIGEAVQESNPEEAEGLVRRLLYEPGPSQVDEAIQVVSSSSIDSCPHCGKQRSVDADDATLAMMDSLTIGGNTTLGSISMLQTPAKGSSMISMTPSSKVIHEKVTPSTAASSSSPESFPTSQSNLSPETPTLSSSPLPSVFAKTARRRRSYDYRLHFEAISRRYLNRLVPEPTLSPTKMFQQRLNLHFKTHFNSSPSSISSSVSSSRIRAEQTRVDLDYIAHLSSPPPSASSKSTRQTSAAAALGGTGTGSGGIGGFRYGHGESSVMYTSSLRRHISFAT